MYRMSCTVYYPDQQMHNIYINILYNVSTPTCFDAYASSLGSLKLVLCQLTKLLRLQLNKASRLKCLHDCLSLDNDHVNILIY